MNETPWLQPDKQRLVRLILSSHSQAFQSPLLTCKTTKDSNELASRELFTLGAPVMAHDGNSDPNIIYINNAGLLLWQRSWSDMIGMPSRLTAPISERNQRARSLSQALQQDSITGYSGIRVDSKGQKFLIKDARIWTLWNEQSSPIGQAATFSTWDWI